MDNTSKTKEQLLSELQKLQLHGTFLTEASRVLASSLDYRTTLASVGRLALSGLADYCLIDLLEGQSVHRLVIARANPERGEGAWQVERYYPFDLQASYGPSYAVRTGKGELVSEVGPDAPDLLAMAGLHSYICVPLVARERPLGALTFGLAQKNGDRHYDESDFNLAEELARRAAVAIDNARLFAAEAEARSQAEVANRTKDDFLATLSHELRTPLNSIIGYTQLLRRGQLDSAAARRALEAIERNGWLQTQLIDDLLDASQILQGSLELNLRPVHLLPIVQEAVESLRSAAQLKHIQLDVQLEDETGLILGEAVRLRQVVLNLLSNAIKFTSEGGRIQVRLGRENGSWQLVVRDSGIGIDGRFLPYVFEVFRQADSSRRREHGGLGLGLAIARYLVEQHGGQIEAESAGQGRGATFTVHLPVMAEPALVVQPSRSTPDNPGHQPLSRLRVLVMPSIESGDGEAALSLGSMVRQLGAEVATAVTAAEALSLLEQFDPDVLISPVGYARNDLCTVIHKVGEQRPPRCDLQAGDGEQLVQAGFEIRTAPATPEKLATAMASLASRRA
ncbi:GAF domain-containing sensor histidine kinase [Gloeobacter kilaueensis]|uniref:Circadian input-output histidine kinase CikA n=1 Tax=Gloeobacter kilaueensis (strain ATCC BAA-2537 / CCAP 1431/1 / ULC 316 / JS1) TaxID=1183438 RepID=U5QJL7_GLOK1|nr:GAF domain-containing sensor histidine kinase [Gloeobacter kilaueensis]AGY59121.1 multi-sensor hybrid histidine kinase [Gloeobacter kilaueensis JS1]